MYNPPDINRNFMILRVSQIAAIFLLAFVPASISAQHLPRIPQPNAPQPNTSKSVQLQAHEIAERLKDSLVAIETRDEGGNRIAGGSGFFIDKQTIITNLHVFAWAHSASVKIVRNGVRVEAQRVLMLDRLHDLCSFTVNYQGIPVKIASQNLRVGDPVYALGNPLGLEATFSAGMVTALRADRIQMDAPISHGSSGGPVANDQGEVIGVSSSMLEGGQNLNFAVPLTYLNKNNDDLPIDMAGRIAISDTEYRHFLGHVKSFKIWRAEYAQDHFEPVRLTSQRGYDRLGNETSSCFYGDNGTSKCYVYERGDDTFITKRHKREGASSETVDNYDHTWALLFEAGRHPVAMEVGSLSGSNRNIEVYDSFGNSVASRTNGVPTSLRVFDESGLLVERTELSASKVIKDRSRYKYEFDANNNWIKQVEEAFFPAFPDAGWITQRVVRREIEYW